MTTERDITNEVHAAMAADLGDENTDDQELLDGADDQDTDQADAPPPAANFADQLKVYAALNGDMLDAIFADVPHLAALNPGRRADLFKFLKEHGESEAAILELQAAIAKAAKRKTNKAAPVKNRVDATDPRPKIEVNDRQLSALMTETMAAIVDYSTKSDPLLFVRGGRLVRVVADENGALRTDLVTTDAMMGIMARAAQWVTVIEGTASERSMNITPPGVVARVLCAAAGWELPALEGIAHGPIFDAAGQLHTKSGYNPATRLFHASTVVLGDTDPTPGNVVAAVALLREDLFVDFPLDAPSLAHAIALAILPFVRPMVRGATPLHLATAPQHRAGKSLLIESALYPALGRPPEMTPDAGDETEWAKVLTTKLLASPACVVLDNIGAELRSPMLATAISEARLTSRILGSNTEVSAAARWTWAATARNPTLHEELMLRSVLIHLAPTTEQPETRTGFKHPRQLDWVAENRDRLVTAIVCLVRNWLENAGGQPYTGKAKGRFESWVGVLGGILDAAGIVGFLDNEADLKSSASPESDAFRAFVVAWWEKHAATTVTSKELFQLASSPDDDKQAKGEDILAEVLGGKTQHSRLVGLGQLLRKYAGRVYEVDDKMLKIKLGGKARSKALQYALQPIARSLGSLAESSHTQNFSETVFSYMSPKTESGETLRETPQTPRFSPEAGISAVEESWVNAADEDERAA